MTWRIYYGDGTVAEGGDRADWLAAPRAGVQVVALMEPGPLRWSCEGRPVRDRQLWTGDDVYDPFGWGEKLGSLIEDEKYQEIWRRACGDD